MNLDRSRPKKELHIQQIIPNLCFDYFQTNKKEQKLKPKFTKSFLQEVLKKLGLMRMRALEKQDVPKHHKDFKVDNIWQKQKKI